MEQETKSEIKSQNLNTKEMKKQPDNIAMTHTNTKGDEMEYVTNAYLFNYKESPKFGYKKSHKIHVLIKEGIKKYFQPCVYELVSVRTFERMD